MTNPTDQITYVDRLSKGLTKREYFAAMAMQGLINDEINPAYYDIRAKEAVAMADLLIEALNKSTQ